MPIIASTEMVDSTRPRIASGEPAAMRGRVESTISVLAMIGMAAGYAVGGFLGETSRLGTTTTLFLGSLVTGSAALCLGGRDVRRVHTVADVSPPPVATGVMS